MLSDKIKQRIKELGLTIPKAAERCGVPQSTLYSYVNEQRTPTITILKKISSGLGIPIEELVRDEKEFEDMMCDPDLKIMFEKVGRLSPQARKSIIDFMNYVYEQENKNKK
jgi:transcriptional regulator with XRE-family HTH domain